MPPVLEELALPAATLPGEYERPRRQRRLRVASLFSGIGGIESGLHAAGHRTELMCEIDVAARAVLAERFPETRVEPDVTALASLPDCELLTAGFPCQDLSQAGQTKGIDGARSGLVKQVFALLRQRPVPWVFIENVPFMLQLGAGAAIRFVVEELERLEYQWAYRVVDARAFGVPQRRERVFLLASLEADPAPLLFSQSAAVREPEHHTGYANGFYWTEGLRGLGWAVDSVPTLKGGSTVGIPSPPGVWLPDGRIVTPSICAAERLQGFPSDWTTPAEAVAKRGYRWRLVGNAVCVKAAEWLGQSLARSDGTAWNTSALRELPIPHSGGWPKAAMGRRGARIGVTVSTWPARQRRGSLERFLGEDVQPLSVRATAGFLERFRRGSLRRPTGFVKALEHHLGSMTVMPKEAS